MDNPKLDKLLQALVAIDRAALSSYELAQALGTGRTTAIRLVEQLRELGCTITSQREGHDYWYTLTDWGVFSPQRVKGYVQALKVAEKKEK